VITSKGFALHLVGEISNIKLEFWAIRRWI